MPVFSRRNLSYGFTTIELLIALAMTGVVAALIMPVADTSLSADDLQTTVVSAVDALRSAQSDAMSGRDNKRWGVHFQHDGFTVFSGSVYSPSDTDNEVHGLSGRVSITAVEFVPGGSCDAAAGTGNCDVHFADAGGQPSEVGSVTLENDAGETYAVTINFEGMTDYSQ